jgi:ribosomal protein L11 methyltransferase
MPWLRIEMQVEAHLAEALSDALLELGAQSVTIEDARAETPDESPRYGEPGLELAASWPDSRLCALVDMQSDAGALTQAAALAAGLQAAPAYAVTLVEDDDWVRVTQSQFSPIRIGQRLWIVPSWCEPPASEDAVVVRLDPGLAFGTGSHATTRLMLTWLEGVLSAEPPGTSRAARRVLDYGCGSGILALAAARLGATDVVAIDLDPRSLEACAKNALANGASIRVEPPARVPAGSYDLLLANILAQPLIDLAPVFAAHTDAGAQIALSGVLTGQAEEVIAAYADEFAMRVDAVAEGWALLAGERR